MVYTHEWDVRKKFIATDEIWACAYVPNARRRTAMYYAKPVLGVLLAGKNRDFHERALRAHDMTPRAFAPYGKNNKILWSKAVDLSARMYADTEAEAVELFDRSVGLEIDAIKRELARAESELIHPDIKSMSVPDVPLTVTADGRTYKLVDDYVTFRRRIEPFLKYREDFQPDVLAMYADEWHPGQKARSVENAEPVTLPSGGDAMLFHIERPGNGDVEDYAVPRGALDGFPGFYVWDPKTPES